MIPKVPKRPVDADNIQCVHVGCGTSLLSSKWWNTDGIAYPGVDAILDVRQPWPWHQTLTHIYAKNLLEVLSWDDAVLFLREAHQALVDGGSIRLVTPSLEWIVETSHGLALESHPERSLQDTRWINHAFRGNDRKFLYSKTTLETLLSRLGFEALAFHPLGQSENPQFRNLKPEIQHLAINGPASEWVIEAKKGKMDLEGLIEFLEEISS